METEHTRTTEGENGRLESGAERSVSRIENTF